MYVLFHIFIYQIISSWQRLVIALKCFEDIKGGNQKQYFEEGHSIQLAKEKGQTYKQ
jgi:hypothetical protein